MDKSRTSIVFEDGIPALMTISDFAKSCGISRPTATKWLNKQANRTQLIGERRMVPARVLYEFVGVTDDDVKRIAKEAKAQ